VLSDLDRLGIGRRVLKVIPDEAGTGDIRACRPLLDLLRAEVERGGEVVQHGYSHRRRGPLRGPLPLRLRGALFAPRDAEFLALDPDASRLALARGRSLLREAGIEVQGFCAPAWLAPPTLDSALTEVGYRFAVTMARLVDVQRGRAYSLGWDGYMGGGEAQERLVGLGAALLRPLHSRLDLVRVYLHPQGAPAGAAYRRALQTAASLARGRRLTTYGEFLDAA
jgi:predicted deacetylase